MTGLFLATLAVDVHVHDTYFVIAHFHYIMVDGMVTAFMGGSSLLVAEDYWENLPGIPRENDGDCHFHRV
jgi:heme/copper-type cytochrome/quinol oxidase subunit 1